MPRASFQTKLFLAALSTALLALVVAGILFALTMQRQTNARVEQTLGADAQLAAELLARAPAIADGTDAARALDVEADRIGALITARVTFIAADGVVLGDSAEPFEALASMENHATRPEVEAARGTGMGLSRRTSATVGESMLYLAIPARHPRVAFVRVSLPLTSIRQQLFGILTAILAALGLALLGGAATAGVLAGRMGQRVRAIALDRRALPAGRPDAATARLRG